MRLSWLWPWRGTARGAKTASVVMYTRQGCHLCEDAWKVLDSAQKRFGFRLESMDVDGDPDLAAQYGTCVPVVLVNGKLRFRGVVSPVLLGRLLRAEQAALAKATRKHEGA
jgi:glutaredoxin